MGVQWYRRGGTRTQIIIYDKRIRPRVGLIKHVKLPMSYSLKMTHLKPSLITVVIVLEM